LRDLARQFDVPAIPDYEHLLARLDVDAVLLSVPHHLHAPLAIQAARAGKHILLEKPMGVDLQDATRIVEACRHAGVRLTVNFSFRYLPAIHVIRELIQEGVLGDTCGIHISHLAFKGTSYWAGGYTSRSPANWRGSKEKAGGGILIMGICHAIDYLRYCTGLEVKRAFGEYGTFNSPVEVEDGIVASCKYDNGAIGSITASTVWRGTPCQEIRIWGTHGTLVFRNNNELHLWTGRRWRGLGAGEEYHFDKLPVNDYTARWIQRFAQALAQNVPHEITAKDGWINSATIDAIYRSQDLGHAVEVETFPWQERL
jgi:predicted dehydrogenase